MVCRIASKFLTSTQTLTKMFTTEGLSQSISWNYYGIWPIESALLNTNSPYVFTWGHKEDSLKPWGRDSYVLLNAIILCGYHCARSISCRPSLFTCKLQGLISDKIQ